MGISEDLEKYHRLYKDRGQIEKLSSEFSGGRVLKMVFKKLLEEGRIKKSEMKDLLLQKRLINHFILRAESDNVIRKNAEMIWVNPEWAEVRFGNRDSVWGGDLKHEQAKNSGTVSEAARSSEDVFPDQ